MANAHEIETLAYSWCTREGRGTPSARALAAIYASTYMDGSHLLCFSDLRALDDKRLEWAIKLITEYVAGRFAAPWERAVALVALYDLIPEEPGS